MNLYRQGDVLIRQVRALPEGATKVPMSGRIVLAHGEVTGHAHAIAPGQAEEYQTSSKDIVQRFLRVVEHADVTHEEHATVPLPAGIYEIVQQREYMPEAVRLVVD